MRSGLAKARWTRRGGTGGVQMGSLRILPLLACALAVIAGMLLMADRARRAADRARQAQVLMERVRNGTERVDVVTWRSLATRRVASARTLSTGLEAYKEVVASVRELRRLGVPRDSVQEVERDVGTAYRGRATITKGTGAYRRLRSNNLLIAGTAGLTAERVTLSLSGPISS
jgi:hypothetical protein